MGRCHQRQGIRHILTKFWPRTWAEASGTRGRRHWVRAVLYLKGQSHLHRLTSEKNDKRNKVDVKNDQSIKWIPQTTLKLENRDMITFATYTVLTAQGPQIPVDNLVFKISLSLGILFLNICRLYSAGISGSHFLSITHCEESCQIWQIRTMFIVLSRLCWALWWAPDTQNVSNTSFHFMIPKMVGLGRHVLV